jgi:predicted MPP superfamily phosphohydrolase
MTNFYRPGGTGIDHHDPMEDELMHRILVGTDALQGVPAPLIAVSFLINALIVALTWSSPLEPAGRPIVMVVISLITSFGVWGMLWLLPRANRSWGPEKPSALALSALITLLLALLGLLNAPLWLGIALPLLLWAAAFYATWIEPFRLGVTRQKLASPKWRGQPLRVLHIGDIHVERISPRERRLNALIESLRPDVIVFSGDFVNLSYNGDARAKDEIREIIRQWQAPLGVYCVPGTPLVESLERVAEFVRGIDQITLLANRWITLTSPDGDRINVCGMITTHLLPQDRERVASLGKLAPADGVNLLLTHSPDVAPEAARAGFDLYLCGHTHGGQIRLPIIGPLATASALGRRFVMGRKQVDGMTIYTSRGVGMEGLGAPRARFLCPPEIIIWDFSTSP